MILNNYYSLFSMPYYNHENQQYEKIITISHIPTNDSILSPHIVKIKPPTLSSFQKNNNTCSNTTCVYAIRNTMFSSTNTHDCTCKYIQVGQLPNLLIYLRENNYSIDTETTTILNNSPITTTYNNNQTLITFISKIAPL